METNSLNYPSKDEHNQLSFRVIHWPTVIVALVTILNIAFWILIGIKYAGFENLSYIVLNLISLYENLFALPLAVATLILFFPIVATMFDSTKPANYRILLFISTLVFIFINLFGFIFYIFEGSKQFDVIESVSISKATYHLARMDNASCNNPPCEVDYWYRLYQCNTADISCKVAFESDEFWRWLDEPNKSASLYSDLADNTLKITVDNKLIYTSRLSP